MYLKWQLLSIVRRWQSVRWRNRKTSSKGLSKQNPSACNYLFSQLIQGILILDDKLKRAHHNFIQPEVQTKDKQFTMLLNQEITREKLARIHRLSK